MKRTYYTLRKPNRDSMDEIWDAKFDTYEDAYEMMCLIYENEKNKQIPHKMWGIWETREYDYNGTINSMSQAVWK